MAAALQAGTQMNSEGGARCKSRLRAHRPSACRSCKQDPAKAESVGASQVAELQRVRESGQTVPCSPVQHDAAASAGCAQGKSRTAGVKSSRRGLDRAAIGGAITAGTPRVPTPPWPAVYQRG
jgi:sigma54-dependent transcription regulator